MNAGEIRNAPRARGTLRNASAPLAGATAGGGLVGVVVAIGYAAGADAMTITALGVAAGAVPGLVHGLVAAGGVRGALAALWRGRGAQ